LFKPDSLYLYHIVETTKVLGKGNRFAIWVQGCDKRCQNCIVPDSWSKTDGGFEISIDDLVQKILDIPNLDGVTISGGEPFLQSSQLVNLIQKLNSSANLNYIIYSGLNYDDILEDEKQNELLNIIDLLIDGEYVDKLNSEIPLIGSSNQGVYIISDDGSILADFMLSQKSRDLEFLIQDNKIFMVGIPPKNEIKFRGEL